MTYSVRHKLEGMLGVRTFDVSPAPFRQWQIRLYSIDRRQYFDLEIDASQLNMRPKALMRRVFDPAIECLKQREAA